MDVEIRMLDALFQFRIHWSIRLDMKEDIVSNYTVTLIIGDRCFMTMIVNVQSDCLGTVWIFF